MKLTYEKDVADILAKWETPAADMQARFDAVIDAQLADASTTQADAALIEERRPPLDELGVFLAPERGRPNDVILLAYQRRYACDDRGRAAEVMKQNQSGGTGRCVPPL